LIKIKYNPINILGATINNIDKDLSFNFDNSKIIPIAKLDIPKYGY